VVGLRNTSALTVAASVLLALVLPVVWFGTATPGLYVDLRLYRYSEGVYIEETSSLGLRGDVVTCVYLGVVMPEYARPLALRCFKGVPVVYVPYETVERFTREWRALLNSRGVPAGSVRSHTVGLIISVHVVNTTNGEVLYSVLDSLPMVLEDFERPQVVYYTVRARRGLYQVQYEKRVQYPSVVAPLLRELASIAEGAIAGAQYYSYHFDYCDCVETYCICYKLVARITPDNLVQYLPGSYFTESGVRYVKTPVLIAYNYYTGATVVTSINIGTRARALVARLTFATGSITRPLMYGVLPSVTLQAGGSTWGGRDYYYYANLQVDSVNTAEWAYIWARPIQEYWEVYGCTPSVPSWYCRKLEERVLTYLSDILVWGSTIVGGFERGLPHSTIMESFFGGTDEVQLVVPGTYLSDGVLLPGEYIALPQILEYYDTCGADFEVGVPVGAMLALASCEALGLGLGTPACIALLAFAGAFQVSLGYASPSISNNGGPGVVVYMRVSRYSYVYQPPWCPGYWCYCEYRVPAGVYLRFGPTPRPR